jgi:hypothetical protein
MATAMELLYEEQLLHLREIALSREWEFLELEEKKFILGRLKARDGSLFWLFVDCEGYQTTPAAFNWYNPETKTLNSPVDTPTGGSFFHSSGRICAPWNRLAYKECDPKGPHGDDWQLSNWITNPRTGGTITLAAMVLRIYRELQSPDFKGRMGK